MFTEEETRAEIRIVAAALDAVGQRIGVLRKIRLHEAGPSELMSALAEAESVRAAVKTAIGQALDISCKVPTQALGFDVNAGLNRALGQLRRADAVAASVTSALVGVAIDLAYDAEATPRRADVELALVLLDRSRAASQAIAALRISGLIRDSKSWVRACTRRLAALRKIEILETT